MPRRFSEFDVSLFDLDALERSDQLAGACEALTAAMGDLAGSEALTRALVHDRLEQKCRAMFWIDVYLRLLGKPGRQAHQRS
ncbi:hypothetical protein [Chelativorans xinjiangense]|uniref:hypothetical protein n=1 Tax=Chelativorans xinjiangense TaxID=2681485 RepID=UPI001358D3BE|nr:hypothetical protein [Chelativorans xinjiangense]